MDYTAKISERSLTAMSGLTVQLPKHGHWSRGVLQGLLLHLDIIPDVIPNGCPKCRLRDNTLTRHMEQPVPKDQGVGTPARTAIPK